MKIVIENFSTTNDTQALYFASTLNKMGHETVVFDKSKSSIYDVMDRNQPDLYITHGLMISQELMFYLENNDHDLDIVFSINGMANEQIVGLDKFVKNNNINSSFFFTHTDKDKIPKINHNLVQIRSAADLNLLEQKPNIEYNIDKAVFVYNIESIKEYDESYHILTTNPNIKDAVDIYLPEISLGPLYRFYNTIIFRDHPGYLPQAFFDAIIMGAKTYFDIDDKDQREYFHSMITKTFKDGVSLDYNDVNKCVDFDNIIKHVLEKHTNKNRTNTLLSHIKKKVLVS
jgi:hypothetical protein